MSPTSKKFKVTKRGEDYYQVNSGTIAGKRYDAILVMSKKVAQGIAAARNRLVSKKANITHKIRAARKQA